MPESAIDHQARQDVAVLQKNVGDCQANTCKRIGDLEGNVKIIGEDLREHLTQDRVSRARALFWQAVIVAICAFAGALVAKVL